MVIRKKTLFTLIGLIIVMLLSIMAFLSFRTHPIGDNTRVVYLGKKTTGSNFIFSDQKELTSYYYGTDMTPEELAGYWGGTIDILQSHQLSIKIQGEEHPVSLVYYKDKQDGYGYPPDFARNTTKKYFFSTLSQNYEALKAAASQ